jgi:hypothetical protein
MFSFEEYRRQVDECLRNDIITDSMSEKEKLSILNKLQCPENSIELYQYRKCNKYSIENFRDNQFTLVHPKFFNDAFEVMPYININTFYEDFHKLDYDTLKWIIGILNERDFTEQEIQKIGGKDNASAFKILYQIKLLKNEISRDEFDIMMHNALMQRTTPLLREICLTKQNLTRIACFSEVYDSPIMWGHYADAGKGFCVRYQMSFEEALGLCHTGNYDNKDKSLRTPLEDNYEANWLMPVIYSTERPDFTKSIEEEVRLCQFLGIGISPDFSTLDLLSPLKFSCYKSTDWAYEREWRWIRTFSSGTSPDYSPISVGKITGLYLGLNIEKEDEEILIEYASRKYLHNNEVIPVFKMRNNLGERYYKFSAQRIA